MPFCRLTSQKCFLVSTQILSRIRQIALAPIFFLDRVKTTSDVSQSTQPRKLRQQTLLLLLQGVWQTNGLFFFQIFHFTEQRKLHRKFESNSKNKTVSNNRWFFKWIFQHQLYRIKCHLIFKYFVLKYTCLNKLKVKADRSRELIKSMPAGRLIKIQFHFQMDIASFNQL